MLELERASAWPDPSRNADKGGTVLVPSLSQCQDKDNIISMSAPAQARHQPPVMIILCMITRCNQEVTPGAGSDLATLTSLTAVGDWRI